MIGGVATLKDNLRNGGIGRLLSRTPAVVVVLVVVGHGTDTVK